MKNEDNWTLTIEPGSKWFDVNLKEIWRYRDLLWLFVKRDIVTLYKQTILGPLWYIFQPIMTTLMFTLVFGRIARISTSGIPPAIFYLSGVTLWGYFADCLSRTSNTFVVNQNLFGKVYFPRITVPGSIIVSSLIRFLIQFGIFLALWSYYYFQGKVQMNLAVCLLPYLVVLLAIISLGLGLLFSSMTTKYRDLQFLLNFAIQLWMYITPIIYPLSSIPEEYAKYIKLNPLTSIVETMRVGFFNQGTISFEGLAYSSLFAFLAFFFGVLAFSRAEKNFMDTV